MSSKSLKRIWMITTIIALIEGLSEPVYYGVPGGIRRFDKIEPEPEQA